MYPCVVVQAMSTMLFSSECSRRFAGRDGHPENTTPMRTRTRFDGTPRRGIPYRHSKSQPAGGVKGRWHAYIPRVFIEFVPTTADPSGSTCNAQLLERNPIRKRRRYSKYRKTTLQKISGEELKEK